MIIVNLLCITLFWVIVTDNTDFPASVKTGLSRLLTGGKIKSDHYRIHWIDCSFCQTWWSGLAYLIFTGNISIPGIALVIVCAYLTSTINILLNSVKDSIETIILKIKSRL